MSTDNGFAAIDSGDLEGVVGGDALDCAMAYRQRSQTTNSRDPVDVFGRDVIHFGQTIHSWHETEDQKRGKEAADRDFKADRWSLANGLDACGLQFKKP